MDGTILSQGTFNSTYNLANPNPGNAEYQAGNSVIIQVPSTADWVKIYNQTSFATSGNSGVYYQGTADAFLATEYYWQRNMANGTALVNFKANGTQVISSDYMTSGGVSIYDPTAQLAGSAPILGTPVAVTTVSNATQPLVDTGSTAGLYIGAVVRLYGTTSTDLNGIDFVVSAIVVNTSFTLLASTNALKNAPGAGGTGGFWQQVFYPPLFYPARKIITDIGVSAGKTFVSTAIEHSMTVGQAIRFNIPTAAKMVELNPTSKNSYLYATITNIIDQYSFNIDTNITGFTTFAWPLITDMPSSFPAYEPIGMNTAVELGASINLAPLYQGNPIYNANTGTFADATINTGYYGLILGSAGSGMASSDVIVGPAGWVHFSAGDAIDINSTVYWVAGKSDLGGL